MKNGAWFKQYLAFKNEANGLNQQFNEETEETMMKVVDTLKEETRLINSFRASVATQIDELERKIDRFALD